MLHAVDNACRQYTSAYRTRRTAECKAINTNVNQNHYNEQQYGSWFGHEISVANMESLESNLHALVSPFWFIIANHSTNLKTLIYFHQHKKMLIGGWEGKRL